MACSLEPRPETGDTPCDANFALMRGYSGKFGDLLLVRKGRANAVNIRVDTTVEGFHRGASKVRPQC